MKNMDRREKAFTLIELLVLVAIIVILIALLLPSLAEARDQARTVACLSNQRQIGVAIMMYSAENLDVLPVGTGYNWWGQTWGESSSDSVTWYSAPVSAAMDSCSVRTITWFSGLTSGVPSYYNRPIPPINGWGVNVNVDPSNCHGWDPFQDVRWRHQGNRAINAVFADCHAATMAIGSFYERNIVPVNWGRK